MDLWTRIGNQVFVLSATWQYFIDMCQRYRITPNDQDRKNAIRITLPNNQREAEYLSALRSVSEILPSVGMFLAHGAVVAMNGFAYMFTAASGTGKTTRANLWLEEFPGSYILNGDKPFVRPTEDSVFVCGTPWSGKEEMERNEVLPLRAVYMVERDDDGKGMLIEKLRPNEAFIRLYGEQVHWPRNSEMKRETIRLLESMVKRVPVFLFRAKPERAAIRLAYEAVME